MKDAAVGANKAAGRNDVELNSSNLYKTFKREG